MKNFLILSLFAVVSQIGFSQCEEGEIEVIIEVESTDQYAYEFYWELVPHGNSCGDGTIFSGGNAAVGCNGNTSNTGGYANFSTNTEGPFCLLPGEYDIIFVDSYGDGGAKFNVSIAGISAYDFTGAGALDVHVFDVQEPNDNDAFLNPIAIDTYVIAGITPIKARVKNKGLQTITSLDFAYNADGAGNVVSQITGISITPGETLEVIHDTPLDLTSNSGEITVDFEISNPNGVEDEYMDDNTASATFNIIEPIENRTDEYINGPYYMEEIAGSDEQVDYPTDLDFHPDLSRNELWVINKHNEAFGSQGDQGGSTVTIFNAGEGNQTEEWKRDGNAWHFMSYPTGIAFSGNGNFGTSPGSFDANHQAVEPNGSAFTGPSLWSSNMEIYAEPSGGNGSHIDMLHESPRCQGIAAERENVFWVLDGHSNDIVRYDFVEDHGPGNDDHSDGIIRRYPSDIMQKDSSNDIVSHLILDADKRWLYVVDHGNQRVIRLDINTGAATGGQPSFQPTEALAEYSVCGGYTSEEIITGLSKPSGIEIIEDNLYVCDYETGIITIYDVSSTPIQEQGQIETGFSSLQGIKVGPDGMLWGVDMESSTVFRMTLGVVSVEEQSERNKPLFYPNPAKDRVFFYGNSNGMASVYNTQGKLVLNHQVSSSRRELNLSSLSKGVYTVTLKANNFVTNQVLVIE